MGHRVQSIYLYRLSGSACPSQPLSTVHILGELPIKLIIETITDRQLWNETLRQLPYAHILQTWEWGDFKRDTTGWIPHRWAFKHHDVIVAMASVGVRAVGPLKLMYASKGPALAYDDANLRTAVLTALEDQARQMRAVWLKIDPDLPIGYGEPATDDERPEPTGVAFTEELRARGWRFSDDQVQFRNTINLDLSLSEDDLLMAMSQNTRRKVRQAEKKDVRVRAATRDDFPTLYQLYAETGTRDDFLIRPMSYYVTLWQLFMDAGYMHALIAEYEGQPIAHVVLFHFGRKCWYFYGASSASERQRMPNYALQWEAIKWAKAQGYQLYDLWGAPDHFHESDSMWGVYEFKRGFRGEVTRHIGAWDYTPFPLIYRAYAEVYPRFIRWLKGRQNG